MTDRLGLKIIPGKSPHFLGFFSEYGTLTVAIARLNIEPPSRCSSGIIDYSECPLTEDKKDSPTWKWTNPRN
jgi:hypothetical protein